jgi:hypothetical protein
MCVSLLSPDLREYNTDSDPLSLTLRPGGFDFWQAS